MEAREAAERVTRVEAERDVARHELVMARLEIDAAGSARAQMEYELAQVQRALATSEDARRKMESKLDVAQQALVTSKEACRTVDEEVSRLTYERVSLLMELRASKDELSVFRAEVAKEKKALEVEYDAGFEAIFNYGYDCCAFVHNICGSKTKIPDGMSGTSKPLTPEFFINPRCPPAAVPAWADVTTKTGVSERVNHSLTVGAKIGDNLDSPSGVAGERDDLGAFGGS